MNDTNARIIYDELTPARLRELLALRERASGGRWSSKGGGYGNSFYITTFSRDFGREDDDGPIASISGEHTVINRTRFGQDYSITKRKIKTARDDADLIAEAVNALAPLCQALLNGDQLDETAWLIEWPANKHNPLRYYAAGEQAVMSASDATRFSRKKDAEAVVRAEKLQGVSVTEHKWVTALAKQEPSA